MYYGGPIKGKSGSNTPHLWWVHQLINTCTGHQQDIWGSCSSIRGRLLGVAAPFHVAPSGLPPVTLRV